MLINFRNSCLRTDCYYCYYYYYYYYYYFYFCYFW